jgi:hypothetical protein
MLLSALATLIENRSRFHASAIDNRHHGIDLID